MSLTLPKPLLFGHGRTSFALIDPSTNEFHRKLAGVNNSLRQHVAISYVWSEWVDSTSISKLPNWTVIRERLLYIVGKGASKSVRSETGGATRCWLDCKCIDQNSETSKSYWIPRMDQIYASAKCTVLLLRDTSLAVLVPVARGMKCHVKSKASRFDWPHNCLLSQSCTSFPEMTPAQEEECLGAMRNLYEGAWRKRAWIFQEILLSKKYLLSVQEADFIDLGDVGVIANLLFQRHLKETWLGDFSDWCRRLYYLRHFYAQSRLHHLSEANVLQMAASLEATYAADKIYALCGILKLRGVPYDQKHTSNEALQVIVGELVKSGRLSWLYAITSPSSGEDLRLAAGKPTPFILTRLTDRLVANRNQLHMNSSSIEFPVMCIGRIVRTKPLVEFLQEAWHWMTKSESFEIPQELEYLYFAPKIIRRIALDVINPLLMDPIFGEICRGLNISKESGSRPTRAWKMILQLYTKDVSSEFPSTGDADHSGSRSSGEDEANARVVWSAALSLQERLKMLQDQFSVIWWQTEEHGSCGQLETVSLGSHACEVGSSVCSMKDDELFRITVSSQAPDACKDSDKGAVLAMHARFQGAIYDLGNVRTFQWSVKVLGIPISISPLDMLEPMFGDHPIWDKLKDNRYDKYIKTDAMETVTLSSLFGKIRNQQGRLVHLKLSFNGADLNRK